MKLRLAAFDLDGTLAEIGAGMTARNLRLLRRLEKCGVHIALCSGKPTAYLCGFARQLALRCPALVGENGAVIQLGAALPPARWFVQPYSDAAAHSIALLRAELDRQLPGLWYQPNLVCLTPFPRTEAEFDGVAACLARLAPQLRGVTVYRHADSFDIAPDTVDKASGMRRLGRMLDIPPEQTAAVGDGVNDYPMFDYAGYAVGVHVAQPDRVDVNVPDVTQALLHLLALAQESG